MRVRSVLLLLFLFISICPQLTKAATDYRFRRLDVANGLSNSEIRCIYKDSNGFMWFGTPSGLNRFDGYEIKTFKQTFRSEQKGSHNNDIWGIQESYDHKLWLQTGYSYTVYDLSEDRFEENVVELYEKYCGVPDFSRLYIDRDKNFWFILWDDVRLYDIQKKETEIFVQGKRGGLSKGLIIDVQQGDNCYWFLFDNGLLECMDAKTHTVLDRHDGLRKQLPRANITGMRLFVDSSGDVWIYGIGTDFGIMHYSTDQSKWQRYSTYTPSHYISQNIVMSMGEDSEGLIWVGTDHGGVSLIDKKTHQTRVIRHNENDPLSLSENTVNTIYRDDTDMMWLGTYKKGVSYYGKELYKFSPVTEKTGLSYADINCFEEDAKGNIWIGTNGGGLIYYDRTKDTYTTYKHIPGNPNSPAGNVIVSLETDQQGKLWIGYYMSGLDCFDGNRFVHYLKDTREESILPDENVWVIYCASNGHLWVATLRGGVIVLDPNTGELLRQFVTEGSVYGIMERPTGEILIGIQRGLYVYNAAADKLIVYEKDIFGKVQLNRFDIQALHEDKRGYLWIGTRNGLFIFDHNTKDLRLYTTADGLSSDLIQCMEEDNDGNMWLATNNGLTYVEVLPPAEEGVSYSLKMIGYNSSDGLQGEQFNYGAAFKTSRSELVFGGSSGYNLFDPSTITENHSNPHVILTDLQIYNQSILPGQPYKDRVILSETISQTSEITLDHSDKYFTLSFSALDYSRSGKARYFYKLEGFNEQWLEADRNSRRVTYTNLNPGTYTFLLKATNEAGGGEEFPVSLTIHITPPFWQTTWAWLVYLLLIIGMIYAYRLYMIKKTERKLEYDREKLRTAQQHEMDEMKLSFFTNISHEFRTPLSLIISPLEELVKKTEEPGLKKSLAMIHRNALQLLNLVNQLLDFRKLDMKGHRLNKSMGDIAGFVKDQASLFTEAMSRKQIAYIVTTRPEHLMMWFDADKIAKILNNVLYNAHKFTTSGGRISLDLRQIEENKVEISVTDNGMGIPEEDLDKIFERFYQVKQSENINNQGSGIGLNLAKEFVALHGGQMWAERAPGGGSRFVIQLPCSQEDMPDSHELPEDTPITEEEPEGIEDIEETVRETPEATGELPKLLIVDDNEDFCLFLTDLLKDEYKVFEAKDGVEGLEIALQEIPDMIVTDVMMPRMDGLEMSKRLKADIRTSHIPLILLTSKGGEESKLEGLNAGADDYITKPFNVDILLVKIRNLVEKRKQTRMLFNEQIRIEPSKITVSSLDEKLIKKAIEYTEANIANPEFSVEELSRELGMSRVHLYKKLTSLTGKTPIEFIRVIRLKRAAQLLEESQLTVSEVAYEVGFNNPKYFRKYFKDEFGTLPSLYGSRTE